MNKTDPVEYAVQIRITLGNADEDEANSRAWAILDTLSSTLNDGESIVEIETYSY